MGFLNEPSVVWETLNSVDGDSFFVDANFHTSLQTTKQDETAEYNGLLFLYIKNNLYII